MVSKGWTLFLLGPVMLCLTVACNKHDPAAPPPVSSFYGVWADDATLSDYRRTQGEPAAFCELVGKQPTLYGLQDSPDSDILLDAINIQPNGAIFRYQPVMGQRALANPRTAQALLMGVVGEDGNFHRVNNPANSALYDYEVQDANGGDSRFRFPAGDSIIAHYPANPNHISVSSATYVNVRALNYLRTDDGEMQALVQTLEGCRKQIRVRPIDVIVPKEVCTGAVTGEGCGCGAGVVGGVAAAGNGAVAGPCDNPKHK